PSVCRVTYEELQSGKVLLPNGREAKSAPLSSLSKARDIAKLLQSWIERGEFTLTEAVHPLPEKSFVKPLVPREGGSR
ncbi:MAG TPA: hypothetical protein DCG32_10320, partial [Sphaerochaeta sp.]|nr:hypothetical protein [Sphaerochaeta sp.]